MDLERGLERTRFGDSDLDLLRFLMLPDDLDRRRVGEADRDLCLELVFKLGASILSLDLDRVLVRDFDWYFLEGVGSAVPYRFGEADRE